MRKNRRKVDINQCFYQKIAGALSEFIKDLVKLANIPSQGGNLLYRLILGFDCGVTKWMLRKVSPNFLKVKSGELGCI